MELQKNPFGYPRMLKNNEVCVFYVLLNSALDYRNWLDVLVIS